jgi:hypothetical protein
MSTKYIASNWRLPNEENSNKSDNYGLTFDGSEYIETTTTGLPTGSFSISVWFNADTTSHGGLYQVGDFNGNVAFYLLKRSNNSLRFYINLSGGARAQNTLNNQYLPNEWNHVVLVFDNTKATDSIKFYINNIEYFTTWNEPVGQTITYPVSSVARIGVWNLEGASNQYYFDGSISEVAVFDYSLNSTQISTLYGSSSLGAGNPMALKPQPVAYYPLGDNSASNPLTQPNEAVEDASVFDFDGSNDFVDLGTEPIVTGEFSISMWIKRSSTSVGDATQVLIGKDNQSAARVFNIFFKNITGQISFWVSSTGTYSSAYRVDTSTVINDTNWHNIVFLNKGDGQLNEIYIDGAEANYAVQGQGRSTLFNTTAIKTSIGADALTGTTYNFNGQISNIVIWNSDQSSEISNIYNSGVPATSYTNTPTAWYKLDQSANWEADSSGAWQIPDAVSAYPQSFDFVPNDKIDATISALNNATALTFSGWVKKTSGNSIGFESFVNNFDRAILYWWTDNNVYWSVRNGSNPSAASSALTIYDWNHIAGTFDGATNTIKLYINGSLVDTQTGQPSSTSANLSNNFHIGISSGSNYNTGQVSNVQIFNTALQATGTDSIETLYNNGVPLTTAIASDNLKAWYKLDNTATFSTNWSVPDASGNGNTGTSSGMTEQNLVNNNVSVLNGESSGMTSANLVLSDLTRAVPYDNYSFKFDAASTDYFNCGSGIGTLIGEDYTGGMAISLWFKADVTNSDDGLFKFNGASAFGEIAMAIYNNNLELRIKGASEMTSAFTDTDSWHHLLINLIGPSGANQVYLDGVAIGSTFTYSSGGLDLNGEDLIIGYYYNTSYPFDGNINNFAVFDEALSTTEILKLYSNGTPQDLENFTPQPIGWYPMGSNSFWNGTSWNIRDMINSNDGTSTNIGADGLQGNSPRSEANGTGTNMDVPSNLEGSTKWSENNSWSINMSSTARVEDTP